MGPNECTPPHCLRYCPLVIDHHTNYMGVRVLISKDDTCSDLESMLLEIRHLHTWYHSSYGTFAHVLSFDSHSAFEAALSRQICGRLGVEVQYSAPYTHHILGKAKRPWRTLRDNASAMMHSMSVPNSVWS
jgi:hypothetical protein